MASGKLSDIEVRRETPRTPLSRVNFQRLSRLARHVRTAAFWCLDSVVLAIPSAPADTAAIVRLDNIGDFVVWLRSGAPDIVRELRRTHKKVVMIGNTSWTSLASGVGLFDEVVGIEPRRFMRRTVYRMRILGAIRRLNVSTMVMPRGARVYLMEDEIVRTSGARERVGVRGLLLNIDEGLRSRSDMYYTRLISVGDDITIHEAIRNGHFADAFCKVRGLTVSGACFALPVKLPVMGAFFAVAPGAGTPGRRWPTANFVSVIDAVHALTGLPCLVIGASDDAPLGQRFLAQCTAPVHDMTGKHSLVETAALLARSSFLISNDSGSLHIAAWAGVQVVALMGGGQFGWFAPYPSALLRYDRQVAVLNHRMPCYGCDWRCRFARNDGDPYPCVDRISPAQVVDSIGALHAAGRLRGGR